MERRIPGLGDLGAAVNPLRLLSELAADLSVIREHTISMDHEVTGMHASVERIEVEMRDLSTRIGALDARMAAVEGAIERLEPYVADLNLALRPFRRARAKFPNRPSVDAADPVDEEPPDERSATA
jgi:tetrahydromethanopterin S-methyltransferase subunit B